MANQVAVTSTNVLFLGLPRYAREKDTPSLARREADGTLKPFPGNAWNEWKPGHDGSNAFVYLNSVHIFADDTVWCVDQGALNAGVFGIDYATPQPGAQKLVQLDAHTGAILQIIRFAEDILPRGAQMNDLRMHGSKMYITDSGLGGLIVHDLATGHTVRRLSGTPVVMASPARVPDILAHVQGGKTFHPPNSDLIEVTADGTWLYWAAPTGPLYRVETRYLNDSAMQDDAIAHHVEKVFDNEFSGGCAMDSRGNMYFCETATGKITVLSPTGQHAVVAADATLKRPDGAFISHDRTLYVPIKVPPERTATSETPYVIYAIALPKHINGIRLGDAVTGRA